MEQEQRGFEHRTAKAPASAPVRNIRSSRPLKHVNRDARYADTAGDRGQVLEGAEIRHDHDARSRWDRGRPRSADDRAARWRAGPDLVLHCQRQRDRAEARPRTGQGNRAIVTFASKGHEIFATVHGTLSLDNNRATIDRLWNRFVAAWFEGGKDDPKLALLRLDAERAEIWVDASSLVAGIKLFLGADPKQDYKDKVAEVSLR